MHFERSKRFLLNNYLKNHSLITIIKTLKIQLLPNKSNWPNKTGWSLYLCCIFFEIKISFDLDRKAGKEKRFMNWFRFQWFLISRWLNDLLWSHRLRPLTDFPIFQYFKGNKQKFPQREPAAKESYCTQVMGHWGFQQAAGRKERRWEINVWGFLNCKFKRHTNK